MPERPAPLLKTALITGSSRGLGLTLADFLAAQGYALILTARGREALEEAAQRLKRYGHPVTALAGDVSDPAHRRTLAVELEGVGVVSVDPGDMRTQMHQNAFPSEDISDRPLPEVTLPFWAWLLGQDPLAVSGVRFLAQGERWEVPGEPTREQDDAA